MAERKSSGLLPKRKSSRKGRGMSCADFFLVFAFGLFAATALFYAVQFVLIGMCQLLDMMKFHLEAFGVQIYPFLRTDKLPALSYYSYNALPWGLAALGVFTGSKLLLVPILICKIQRAYAIIRVAAMNWESTLKNQDFVLLATMESNILFFILLVAFIMACASDRTLISYYFGTETKQRKVKINIARRVEEGAVDIGQPPSTVEAEVVKRRMETLLQKKEEELVAACVAAELDGGADNEGTMGTATAPSESGSIYPASGAPIYPV